MVQELEKNIECLKGEIVVLKLDKEGLQEKVDDLLNENESFKRQLNDLNIEREKLLNERSEMVSFSLNNTNIKGMSTDMGKPEILKYI